MGSEPRIALKTAALLAAALAVLSMLVAGCGEGEGVAEGATVTAYVEASMCRNAREELARKDNRAGDVRVKAVCLPSPWNGKELDLATVGSNARRATEDSTTVAFLEAPGKRASRFTHPILESAAIAWIASSSGQQAMAQLLQAIDDVGSTGNLREEVGQSLD